uniref:V protein n=1 Tax=avian paramyxovirus 2 TaxID=2560313 RepID=A0A193KUY2_9MONO|nr:V protein [Avian metaavulavirus 2]
MEFTDDAEIAELLDLGTSVIQELQRAELKGPQTTGKPKVPSGNTRNLATLWEKESTSQAEPGADHGNQQGDTGIPAEGMSQGTPTTETTTDQHEDAPDPKRDIEADSTNSRPGDDLDKALAKLETRAKQNRAAQPTVKKGEGGQQVTPKYPACGCTGDSDPADGRAQTTGRARSNSWKPGHRREYSFACRDGRLEVISWCNPVCTPIRAEPRRESCKCGKCPVTCILCCQSQ